MAESRGEDSRLRANRPWLGYDEVFFDCDSTLTAIEGIEELARFKGVEEAVARMTREAMEGQVDLEAVYAQRLALLRPTRGDLRRIASSYRQRAVPDARALVAALVFLGRRVHIVSGGLAEPVASFGDWLGIGADWVHAVDLEFDQLAGRWWEYAGPADNPAEAYLDFVSGPLSESRGKQSVISQVRQSSGRAMLVGDGVSDLMARSAVELFVGFGGVVRRERVAAEADVYVASSSLAPVLPLVARPQEYQSCQGTPHQSLFDRGIELIAQGSVLFHHAGRKESFDAAYQALYPRANRGAA